LEPLARHPHHLDDGQKHLHQRRLRVLEVTTSKHDRPASHKQQENSQEHTLTVLQDDCGNGHRTIYSPGYSRLVGCC
jgi:hypothetical protein